MKLMKITVKSILPLLLTLFLFQGVFAQEDAFVPYVGDELACGTSFLVYPMQEQPVLSDSINRQIPGGDAECIVRAKDNIFSVRLRLMNVSHTTFEGLDPKSFALTGYLKGKPKTYYPVVIEETDYRAMPVQDLGSYISMGEFTNDVVQTAVRNRELDQSDLYISPDADYYAFFNLPMPADARPSRVYVKQWKPLRTWDLVIAFDVKPFLQDWVLTISPTEGNGANDIDPCTLSIKFPSVKNSGTNEVYVYFEAEKKK